MEVQARPAPLSIGAVLFAVIAGIAFSTALNVSSNLAQTSDSAQGFVVGHAIALGNLLLSGWHFPIDNFYFTDSLPYAAAERIVGPRPYLLALIPALVYTLIVLLALRICFRPAQAQKTNLEGICAIALLLAAPAWIGDWNPMLMTDMHTTTALAALGALVLCAKFAEAEPLNPLLRTWIPGCFLILVCLAVASDPFCLVFAFGPAAAILAAGSVRRKGRGGVTLALALALLAAGIAAGLLVPPAIAALGGFTTENDVSFHIVPVAQWWPNLIDVLFAIITLCGANPSDVHGLPGAVMFGIRVVGLVVVLAVMSCVAYSLFRNKEVPLLDRFLLAGAAALTGICVPSAQFAKGVKQETLWHGGPPLRFLVPAVLFAAILSGRQISNVLGVVRNPKWRLVSRNTFVLLAGIGLLAGACQSFALAARMPWIGSNPALSAAQWLGRHELSQGVGEYWSANLLTAMSGNAVTVRSVVPEDHKLVPYIWVEDRGFYAKAPEFVVWQERNQTGVTENLVRATYRVCDIKRVSAYRIALLNTAGNPAHCS